MQVGNAVVFVALNAFSYIVVVVVNDSNALLVRHITLCGDRSIELLHEHHELMRFHIVKLTIFNLLAKRLDVNKHAILLIVAPLIGITPRLLDRHVTIAVVILFRRR